VIDKNKTMSGRISFITSNEKKAVELKTIFPTLEQIDIDLPEIQSINAKDVIYHKLVEGRKHLPNGAIFVEDTALHLACLNGFPGALIKWLLNSIGCDGIHALCEKLGNNQAKALTVIGFLGEGKKSPIFSHSSLKGTIASPRGKNGFGWDPIFVPEGMKKSLAEMSSRELEAIKMRRKAAEKMAMSLKKEKSDINNY